jgi:uncharacterized protein YdbL (DUF1318 family)
MQQLLRRCALVLALTLATAAHAASELDTAKAAGQVGERPDGYVGLVAADAPETVKQLVSSVNQGRREKYTEIATRNSAPVEAVAARAGAKLIERAAPGEYVMDAEGRWVRK